MGLEEGMILAIYIFILLLAAVRFLPAKSGKVVRRLQTGKAMTIGTRQVQEDNYGMCQTQDGFMAVLADGMGKNYGGKISSQQVVDTMKEMFANYRSVENPAYFFRNAFHKANAGILEKLDDGRGGASAGVVIIKDNYLHYAVVGNVKIAVFRKGDLVPVSSGHTIDMLVENKFVEGTITKEEALKRLEDKRVYNYLGQDQFEEVELFDAPIFLKEKDIIVLMSDGLYGGIEWKAIEEILAEKKKCQQKAYEIIEAVNAGKQKEKDNACVVLVEVSVG